MGSFTAVMEITKRIELELEAESEEDVRLFLTEEYDSDEFCDCIISEEEEIVDIVINRG